MSLNLIPFPTLLRKRKALNCIYIQNKKSSELLNPHNFYNQTEDILQSLLGVGRKFHHRRFIRRIGGVKALLNTSLLPSLAFRISFSSLGTIKPCRAHLAEPGRPEHVQARRTLRPEPWLLRLTRFVSDLPGISKPSPDGILLTTCISYEIGYERVNEFCFFIVCGTREQHHWLGYIFIMVMERLV